MMGYWRDRLVERMRVTNMVMLWKSTLALTKHRLHTPWMHSCQMDDLQGMILPNLVCWIITEDDGKGSARCAQCPNGDSEKSPIEVNYLRYCMPFIVGAHSVLQS